MSTFPEIQTASGGEQKLIVAVGKTASVIAAFQERRNEFCQVLMNTGLWEGGLDYDTRTETILENLSRLRRIEALQKRLPGLIVEVGSLLSWGYDMDYYVDFEAEVKATERSRYEALEDESWLLTDGVRAGSPTTEKSPLMHLDVPRSEAVDVWDVTCGQKSISEDRLNAVEMGDPAERYMLESFKAKIQRLHSMAQALGKLVEPTLIEQLRNDMAEFEKLGA